MLGGLIGLIINIIVIVNGMNKNPWLWGGILTLVNGIGLIIMLLFFPSYLEFELIWISLLATVIVYFFNVALFAIINSMNLENQALYVILFIILEYAFIGIMGTYFLPQLDIQTNRTADSKAEIRVERNDSEEYKAKEYDITQAKIIRCAKETTDFENEIEIKMRASVFLYYINDELVKYSSLKVLKIEDDELREEKGFYYNDLYRLQYQQFDSSTNAYNVALKDDELVLVREVKYYLMNLKELYDTSSRFRTATNSDYTINANKIIDKYQQDNWQCKGYQSAN